MSLYFVGVVIKSATVLLLFRGAQIDADAFLHLIYWSPAGFGFEKNVTTPTFQPSFYYLLADPGTSDRAPNEMAY